MAARKQTASTETSTESTEDSNVTTMPSNAKPAESTAKGKTAAAKAKADAAKAKADAEKADAASEEKVEDAAPAETAMKPYGFDLSVMTMEALRALEDDLPGAIAAKEAANKAKAVKAAREAAQKFGVTLEDVMADMKSASAGTVNPPKYANPENPAETWTGRGRKPQWMISAIAAGKNLADMEIG